MRRRCLRKQILDIQKEAEKVVNYKFSVCGQTPQQPPQMSVGIPPPTNVMPQQPPQQQPAQDPLIAKQKQYEYQLTLLNMFPPMTPFSQRPPKMLEQLQPFKEQIHQLLVKEFELIDSIIVKEEQHKNFQLWNHKNELVVMCL